MDDFEVANQFTTILKNLTPHIQSLTKASYFALKNSDKEDYIIPSIITVLEDSKIDLNLKSFIFQFIEILIIESFNNLKLNGAYIHSLKLNLPKIINLVCPVNNLTNLNSIFNGLCNISKYYKFNYEDYKDKFNNCWLIDENDIMINEDEDSLNIAWKIILQRKRKSQIDGIELEKKPAIDEDIEVDQLFNIRNKNESSSGDNHLTKKQILSRMEDERETHKRLKENLWCVNRDKSNKNFITEDEFLNYYWNKTNEITKNDEKLEFLNNLKEINDMVLLSYKDKQI
ncbi:uncharacterized protein KGF55_004812 [Candida pseudojiufengensis]|uniref:uncharacterized protein n=1 Tax=Candida pseudojiufengensis TaxID=497109 RepID=UPI00222493BB|nr:uncharacterized protein KGF55_004812 [Candida pseudojiufengensis]KAI5960089.1 hypothetical protein KGF55_004812 [Candida pseudojiufengensis]